MENVNSCRYIARIDEIKEIPGADNIKQGVIGGWILFSLGWSEQIHICFINLWGTIRNRNLSTLR